MQINQQISRKMEELDKMKGTSPDNSKVPDVCRRLAFLSRSKYLQKHFTEGKIRDKKWHYSVSE